MKYSQKPINIQSHSASKSAKKEIERVGGTVNIVKFKKRLNNSDFRKKLNKFQKKKHEKSVKKNKKIGDESKKISESKSKNPPKKNES